MALFQRGKTWWFDLTAPNGERLRETTKTSNKQLAIKFEAKMRLDLFNQHQMGITQDRPFSEAAGYFLEIKSDNRTVLGYEKQLAWWVDQFARLSLQQIDEGAIVAAILKKRKSGISNATCNRYLAVLRAALRAAHKRKWIMRVPDFSLYDEPKARVRWLTEPEVLKLMAACPEKWRAMMQVSLATGLRQSNVRAMRWDWVDLEKETLTIPGTFFKNGLDFAIPLPREAAEVIRANVGVHPEFVFTHEGSPIVQLSSKTWSATLKRAGIENFKWHDLRHTWASRMTQKGVPTQALQKLGGWQTMAMVNKYAHHDVESLRGFANLSAPSSTTPTPVLPPVLAQVIALQEGVSASMAQIRHIEGKKHLRRVA